MREMSCLIYPPLYSLCFHRLLTNLESTVADCAGCAIPADRRGAAATAEVIQRVKIRSGARKAISADGVSGNAD